MDPPSASPSCQRGWTDLTDLFTSLFTYIFIYYILFFVFIIYIFVFVVFCSASLLNAGNAELRTVLRCFCDVIQACNLRTCKNYEILPKNRTLMFRRIILVINDGASFRSGEIQSPVARECHTIWQPAKILSHTYIYTV